MANKNASPKAYAMERTKELEQSVPFYVGLALFLYTMTAVTPLVVGSRWGTNSIAAALALMAATIVITIVLTLSVKELAKLRGESHIPTALYWFWLAAGLAVAIPVVCLVAA